MKKYNSETENVIEYLSSLNNPTINGLLDELLISEDLEEKMDIVYQILSEIELSLMEEGDDITDLEDDLKDITL